ncbi:MAG: hypothetical protein V4436_03670 [Patescibacteria group bacterium]
MPKLGAEQLIERLHWNLFGSLSVFLFIYPDDQGVRITLCDKMIAITTLQLAEVCDDDQVFCDAVEWVSRAVRANVEKLVELMMASHQMPYGYEIRSYSPVSKLLHHVADLMVKEARTVREHGIVGSDAQKHASAYQLSVDLQAL